MDLLFAVFVCLCLWGVNRPAAEGIRNRDGLARTDTNAMRGILAVLIVFHHLSLTTNAGYSAVILKKIGFLVVAAFYALSGYGLLMSYLAKGCRLDHFWRKRCTGVIFPYLIISLIYVAVRLALGDKITVTSYLLSFVNGTPMVRYSWFILTILVFYVFYYLAARIAKQDVPLMIFLVFVAEVFFLYGMKKLDFEPFWYDAAWAFPLGMVWAYGYRSISETVSRHPWVYIGLTAMLFVIFYFSSTVLSWCGFYGEMLTACTFAVLVMLSMFKLRFSNPALQFLGNISFELYLMHGLFIMVFSRSEMLMRKPILLAAAVIACAVISAWLMHILFQKCLFKKGA